MTPHQTTCEAALLSGVWEQAAEAALAWARHPEPTVSRDPRPHFVLNVVQLIKGQFAEAVATYRKALAVSDNPQIKAMLIQSLVKTGERSEAAKLLDELQAESARRYVPNWQLGIAYGSLGKMDEAFAFLNKEITDRGSVPQNYRIYPIFDELRADSRFDELLRRVEASKME